MSEYRILEQMPAPYPMQKWDIIGEGFMSFNAVWMAITADISHRLMNGRINLVLRIERVEGPVEIIVAVLQLDDRPTDEMLDSLLTIKRSFL